ncbi:hypothetical protein MPER_07470, partial [Moniliophthora perniciosa FA553]
MSNKPPCASHEGVAGTEYPDLKVSVTSPTEDVISPPLYGPFNSQVGHFALIPYPSIAHDHPYSVAWLRPGDDDFVPISSSDQSGSTGSLGLLKPRYLSLLGTTADSVSALIQSCQLERPSEKSLFVKDRYVCEYTFALKYLRGHLSCPSSRERALMTWALWQRTYLELVARIEWISYYEGLYRMPPRRRVESQGGVKVVGALVGDTETAERLWLMGKLDLTVLESMLIQLSVWIPFWLVRPLHEKTAQLRVDRWVLPLSPVESLAKRSGGFHICMDDTVPQHRTVFVGSLSAVNLSRYQDMAQYPRLSNTTRTDVDTDVPP